MNPSGGDNAGSAVLLRVGAGDLEGLVRRLLELLGNLTGLESTYLTAIDWDGGVQDIVFARNVGDLQIPAGLRVAWSDTLCRRALEGGPSCTDDVPGLYPESGAARELGIQTYVTVPVRDADGEAIGTLCGASSRRIDFGEDQRQLLVTLAEMIELHLQATNAVRRLADANDALERLALTDSLTLLSNRRHLDDTLRRLGSQCARHGGTASLMIIDIDWFKSINDSRGHEGGDQAIVAVAGVLRSRCRVEDVVGRWGGDEFVVVCPDTDGPGVARLAERVAEGVAALAEGERVTLSIGTATGEGRKVQDLLAVADAALYKAKAGGRDRIQSVVLG